MYTRELTWIKKYRKYKKNNGYCDCEIITSFSKLASKTLYLWHIHKLKKDSETHEALFMLIIGSINGTFYSDSIPSSWFCCACSII